MIKRAYGINDQQYSGDNVDTDVSMPKGTNMDNASTDVYGILKETIDTLRDQLASKDKQINELTATIRLQAESINADRKNELAGTIIDGQKLIENGTSPKKRGFFGIFKKRSAENAGGVPNG